MKKKVISILLCGIIILGFATGCGSKSVSEEDVLAALNKVVNDHIDEAIKQDKTASLSIKDFKDKLDMYSDYQLLDKSGEEFTTKPTEPKYIIKPFYEIDQINTSNNTDIARYFLVYNEKTETYYSTLCGWDKDNDRPIFVEAKELK